jgi:hypothetical protein
MLASSNHRNAGISPALTTEARIEATSRFDPGFHFSFCPTNDDELVKSRRVSYAVIPAVL